MDPTTKLRNIAFLDPSDPGYRKFVEESRLANMRIRESRGNRAYPDLISEQFELAVREWLKPVGGTEKRILSYERLDRSQKYITRYRELDFVIEDGDCIYIGELKVSSSTSLLRRAYRQLSEAMEVLGRTGKKVRAVLIYINLSHENARTTVNTFNPDFTKVQFMHRSINGRAYEFLHLSPVEIFQWACENNFISEGGLLELALEEARNRQSDRASRRDLRSGNVPEAEWPPHLREKKSSGKIYPAMAGTAQQRARLHSGSKKPLESAMPEFRGSGPLRRLTMIWAWEKSARCPRETSCFGQRALAPSHLSSRKGDL